MSKGYEAGSIVTIYEDPITEQVIEGVAIIREVVERDDGEHADKTMLRCIVRFFNSHTREFEDMHYRRDVFDVKHRS